MRLFAVVLMGLVAASVGCADSAASNRDTSPEHKAGSVSIETTPAEAVSPGPAGGGLPAVRSVDFPAGQSAGAASVVARDAPTVEELL